MAAKKAAAKRPAKGKRTGKAPQSKAAARQPVQKDPPPRRTFREACRDCDRWVHGKITGFEKTGTFHALAWIAGVIGFVVLLGTAYAIVRDFEARTEERELWAQERENWRLDRIERARNRLAQPVGGNMGKGEALSYLIAEKVDVTGIDLSCEAMGGIFNDGACSKEIILTGLTSPPQVDVRVNLRGTIVYELDFSDTLLMGDMSGTSFHGGTLKESFIAPRDGTLEGLLLSDMDMTNVSILGAGNIRLNASNISGAEIELEPSSDIPVKPGAYGPLSVSESVYAANNPPFCSIFDFMAPDDEKNDPLIGPGCIAPGEGGALIACDTAPGVSESLSAFRFYNDSIERPESWLSISAREELNRRCSDWFADRLHAISSGLARLRYPDAFDPDLRRGFGIAGSGGGEGGGGDTWVAY